MNVYRLSRGKYARDTTGEGARLFGGRWNHIGTPCLYSSESRALALLEYSANIELVSIPRSLCMVTFEIPTDHLFEFTTPSLPGNWKVSPAPHETKDYGTKLLTESNYLIIKIPSAIIEEEFNYLINPLHADINKIKAIDVTDFIYDIRIKDSGII